MFLSSSIFFLFSFYFTYIIQQKYEQIYPFRKKTEKKSPFFSLYLELANPDSLVNKDEAGDELQILNNENDGQYIAEG